MSALALVDELRRWPDDDFEALLACTVGADMVSCGMPGHVIYCHTHRVSQKRYVGQTNGTADRRWLEHLSMARRGAGFPSHAALRKYGADAFDHEVLETVDTLDAANEAETWWIAHFGSDARGIGYNIAVGGGVGPMSEDTRRVLSVALRLAWATKPPEVRAEIAQRRESGKRARGQTAAERSALGRRAAAALIDQSTPEERRARSQVGAVANMARSAARWAQTALRRCERCGSEMMPHVWPTHREGHARYAKRKLCRSCSGGPHKVKGNA